MVTNILQYLPAPGHTYHGDFYYYSQNEKNFVLKMVSCTSKRKKTKDPCIVQLQRYCWIFRSNCSLDSPHPPKFVQNTMAMYGQVCLWLRDPATFNAHQRHLVHDRQFL